MGRRTPLTSPAPDAPPVLIVEDDEVLRAGLAEILRTHLGLGAVEVGTGAEAFQALDGQPFALALVNLALPGEDGLDVVQRLFRYHPEVPIVAMVIEQGPEEAAEVILAGAAHVLAHPLTPERVAGRIRDVLDADEQARDRADRVVRRIRNAHVALRERRLAAAAAHARRALALDAARPEPFNILGVVAQLRMHVPEAQRFYRTALALDDQYGPARRNLDALSAFPRRLSTFVIE
jgi:DNA-binding response OmpR family regulator